jgi:hypothetical protein
MVRQRRVKEVSGQNAVGPTIWGKDNNPVILVVHLVCHQPHGKEHQDDCG